MHPMPDDRQCRLRVALDEDTDLPCQRGVDLGIDLVDIDGAGVGRGFDCRLIVFVGACRHVRIPPRAIFATIRRRSSCRRFSDSEEQDKLAKTTTILSAVPMLPTHSNRAIPMAGVGPNGSRIIFITRHASVPRRGLESARITVFKLLKNKIKL